MAKKLFAMLLSVLMLVSLLAGCGSSGNANSNVTADGKTSVTVGLAMDPGSLDPFHMTGTGTIATFPTIYEGLFTMDGMGGAMLPTTAQSYEHLEKDGDLWVVRVHLYDNVVDAAGNKYTANDVKWFFEMWDASGINANTETVDKVEVVDELTVDFYFNVMNLGTVENIICYIYGITQKSYEEAENFAQAPVTTSHYKVTEYVSGSSIKLEARDDYWQSEDKICKYAQANVDQIVFKVITDANQMDIAMENGEVDMIPSVAATDLYNFLNEDLTAKEGYYSESYLRGAHLMLFFNCHETNTFSNADLRKACAYAVDTSAIVSNVLGGQGVALAGLGSECFGDFQTSWYDEEYYGRNGVNMEKAKEHLAASGIDTSETFTIITEADETIKRVAQIVQGYLIDLGLDVQLESYDTAIYEELCTDPAAWDMFIGYRGNKIAMAGLWNWAFNADVRGGATCNFVVDEQLQNYVRAAIDPVNGHTAEDVANFHYRMKDNCYVYGIFSQQMYVIANDKVTDLVFDASWGLAPGACTYNFG